MKVTRALLLSTKKQAVSHDPMPALFVASDYRYLISTAEDGSLLFQVFRIVDEQYEDSRKQQRTRRVAVDTPHVTKTFKDTDELIGFLRDHDIDQENNWSPVED